MVLHEFMTFSHNGLKNAPSRCTFMAFQTLTDRLGLSAHKLKNLKLDKEMRVFFKMVQNVSYLELMTSI